MSCLCTTPSERAGVLAGQVLAILEDLCDLPEKSLCIVLSMQFLKLLQVVGQLVGEQVTGGTATRTENCTELLKTLNRLSFNSKDRWIWVY